MPEPRRQEKLGTSLSVQMPLLVANVCALGLGAAGLTALTLLLFFQERAASRYVAHLHGWRAVLATGWLGVPLHELSHLVTARVFGHRIIAWKLWDPDPATGTLGYVRHAYSRRSLLQLLGTLFIGLAPLAAGALALALLWAWMLPEPARSLLWLHLVELADQRSLGAVLPQLAELVGQLTQALWQHRTPWLPLQLYLGVCIASHMAPSPPDLAGALPGLALLLSLAAAAAGLAALGGFELGGVLAVLPPLLVIYIAATLFQALAVLAVALLARCQRRQRAFR